MTKFDYTTSVLSDDFLYTMNNTNTKELYLDVNGLVATKCKLDQLFPNLQKLSLSYNRFFDNLNQDLFFDAIRMQNLTFLDISHQSKYPSQQSQMVSNKQLGGRKDKNLWFPLPPRIKVMNISAAFRSEERV